jgi:hypothetical protein
MMVANDNFPQSRTTRLLARALFTTRPAFTLFIAALALAAFCA